MALFVSMPWFKKKCVEKSQSICENYVPFLLYNSIFKKDILGYNMAQPLRPQVNKLVLLHYLFIIQTISHMRLATTNNIIKWNFTNLKAKIGIICWVSMARISCEQNTPLVNLLLNIRTKYNLLLFGSFFYRNVMEYNGSLYHYRLCYQQFKYLWTKACKFLFV